MGKNFSVKNLSNGNRNKKEFQNPENNREIALFLEKQEPRKVVIKKSTENNSFPPDFGNGAFF